MSQDAAPGNAAGKKVYFLNPNSVIQGEMVSELLAEEYEVYLIKDYRKAQAVFRRYPTSLVFINIDDVLTEPEWELFITNLLQDPVLVNLQLGILTYNPDPALAQKYLMEFNLSAGFIKLSLGLRESTDIVKKVLEANEARGRRRFLRVRCDGKNSTLNVRLGHKPLTGIIVDISSAGMACTLDPEPQLVVHSLIESIQLRLKGALCLVSGVVMGSREEEGRRVYVILFSPKTGADVKDKIRNFMQWSLQQAVEEEMRGL